MLASKLLSNSDHDPNKPITHSIIFHNNAKGNKASILAQKCDFHCSIIMFKHFTPNSPVVMKPLDYILALCQVEQTAVQWGAVSIITGFTKNNICSGTERFPTTSRTSSKPGSDDWHSNSTMLAPVLRCCRIIAIIILCFVPLTGVHQWLLLVLFRKRHHWWAWKEKFL